jgi:hypothetical protein
VINPLNVKTSTLRKSVAVKHSQWAFRNGDHRVCASRAGAGSIPFSLRMLAIVEMLTSRPSSAYQPFFCPTMDSSVSCRVQPCPPDWPAE